MTTCATGDCSCYIVNRNYYAAAITVANAAIAVDNAQLTADKNQLSADQTGYYYYLEMIYEYGCSGDRPSGIRHALRRLFHASSATWKRRLDLSIQRLDESKLDLQQAKAEYDALQKPKVP